MSQKVFPGFGQKLGRVDPRVDEMIFNALFSRAQLARQLSDPRRDIDHECGFPKTEDITHIEYKAMYDRLGVATRVVDLMPDECWAVQPEVCETENEDEETSFEKGWSEVGRSLRQKSWGKNQNNSSIWSYLHRVDKRSGIGHFGLLLLGVDDGMELYEPAEGIDDKGEGSGSSTPKRKLVYLRVFDESQITVSQWQNDNTNPRYGQPTEYTVKMSDPTSLNLRSMSIQQGTSVKVHWTRVIHVADNPASNEIIGIPRMLPVYDNLIGLRKLYGGSPEMYWRGALPGLALETIPQLGSDVTVDTTNLREQMEQYMNGLQRYFLVAGTQAKSLAPQVVDPTPQINAQLDAICIKIGVPKRIFIGSERGELASSQDSEAWNDRISFRQNNYLTPSLIMPFIDRLILLSVLPAPTEYSVKWPGLGTLNDLEQADIAAKRTEAMAKYVQGDVEALIAPLDFLTKVIGMDTNEAMEILAGVSEAEPLPLREEVVEPMTGGNPNEFTD